MHIELLDEQHWQTYDAFLKKNQHSLLFASNRYRLLLKEFLQAEDYYLLLLNDTNDILGALPLFIKYNDRFGPIVNSLPFYGSNGAIIASDGESGVRNELIRSYRSFLEEIDCAVATLITSPFEQQPEEYERLLLPTFTDKRIGQLTPLPIDNDTIDEQLMSMYHQKTRNLVRKAIKSGLVVSSESNPEVLNFLIETHHENLSEIGGQAKPTRFFYLIPEYFEYDKDYRIYYAYKGNQLAAALLLFYFNRTVEYFTPVVKKEYRSEQPLSLLIYRAMTDAAKAGYLWWNWGGTWLSQEGVYHFKRRWGTEDKPYYYYVNVRRDSILSACKAELLDAYPYFYVVPFDCLSSS